MGAESFCGCSQAALHVQLSRFEIGIALATRIIMMNAVPLNNNLSSSPLDILETLRCSGLQSFFD